MAESSFLQSVAAQESLERKSNFSLLEQLIDLADQAAKLPQDSGRQSEAGLLSDASLAATLRLWAAARVGLGIHLSRDALVRLIGQDVAAIDSLIQRQVDAVLHAPDFQRLEASWRGLEWLARQVEEANIDSARRVTPALRFRFVSCQLRKGNSNATKNPPLNLIVPPSGERSMRKSSERLEERHTGSS